MDQHIYITDTCFDFTKISISQPVAIQGGSYITKIKCDNSPLYIQTPKCFTKQGLNETSKKAHIDLMYSNDTDNDTVIEWFENLEATLVKLIYDKRELWFQNEMDLEDIENFFNPITRSYKGGKFHLIRINIPKNKTINSQYLCNVYDENENMLPIEDLNETHNIIPCMEVQGIRFSARNFQVELIGKQLMVLINKPIFNTCIIKRDTSHSITNGVSTEYSGVVTKSNMDIDMLPKNTDDDNSKNNTIHLETITTNVIDDTLNENKSEQDHDTSHDQPQEPDTSHDQPPEPDQTQDQTQDQPQDLPQDQQQDQPQDQPQDQTQELEQKQYQKQQLDQEQEPDYHDDIIDNNNKSGMNNNVDIDIDIDIANNLNNKTVSLEDVLNKINVNSVTSNIKLKNPNDVYYEMYKLTRQKAKQHKKASLVHYLEAKKIKNTYLLDDLYDSNGSSTDEDDNSDSEEIKNHMNDFVEELT